MSTRKPKGSQSRIAERYNSSSKVRMLAWAIVALGAAFYMYEYFLRIAPSTMSRQLMSTFNITADGFGHMVAFYYFAYTPMQAFVGVLLDRYGARRLLALATLVCALGAFIFADANTVGMAEFGRFLVGFGSAFAFVGTLKLASIWLPPERFASVSGSVAALGTIGGMLGDVIFTKLVALQGWRGTIFSCSIVGVVLAVVLFLVVRDAADPHEGKSVLPPLTFSKVFRGLGHALTKFQFWVNGLVGALTYLAMSAFAELWGIPFLEQAHGYSPASAANMMFITFLGWTIGGPIMGAVSDKIKLRKPILLFGALAAAVVSALIVYTPQLPTFVYDTLFFFFGAFASAQVVVFAIGREIADRHIAGTAIALTNMFVMLGGMLFQPLIGKLLDYHWAGQLLGNTRVYTMANYQFALSVLPIAMIVAFVLTLLFLRETNCTLHNKATQD